ncbi:MAG: hypothetical protein GWN01_08990 [Nitrosopumilaceae archaeon]|nr:hypothetical protein [Nitrosopumilaceae archaeon]NIU01044.1 hypothetical protein [Nitrosopumilaceae archaeon]NIU87478.1 hypothetical protein [Nitrosopumilaceae archaeon]NIV65528.1 hypothetical protein [Nitrosopumilaceae archaeon]NIX61646.1 hypothetical protein [Nitrosopumilaceae archaeon]
MELFNTEDIEGVSLHVPITDLGNTKLKEISMKLSLSELRTSKQYDLAVLDYVDEVFPVILFNGKGFAIGVTNGKIAIQFLDHSEFPPLGGESLPDELSDQEKLFSKEKLLEISNDLNYVIGLIFGKLNQDIESSSVQFNFRVQKKGSFGKDPTYVLKDEAKVFFGNVSDLHMKSFRIEVKEKLFGTDINSTYLLSERSIGIKKIPYVRAAATFDYSYKGPIDLFDLFETGKSKLNDLVNRVTGGINVA